MRVFEKCRLWLPRPPPNRNQLLRMPRARSNATYVWRNPDPPTSTQSERQEGGRRRRSRRSPVQPVPAGGGATSAKPTPPACTQPTPLKPPIRRHQPRVTILGNKPTNHLPPNGPSDPDYEKREKTRHLPNLEIVLHSNSNSNDLHSLPSVRPSVRPSIHPTIRTVSRPPLHLTHTHFVPSTISQAPPPFRPSIQPLGTDGCCCCCCCCCCCTPLLPRRRRCRVRTKQADKHVPRLSQPWATNPSPPVITDASCPRHTPHRMQTAP